MLVLGVSLDALVRTWSPFSTRRQHYDAEKFHQQKRKCMREVSKLTQGLMQYRDDAEVQSMGSEFLEDSGSRGHLCLQGNTGPYPQ